MEKRRTAANEKKSRLRNNNREEIRLLARESYKSSKGRNRLLIGAVAFGMTVLCTVFSIALGKVDAEYLQAARGTGTIANTFLERGTNAQYNEIKELGYIKNVGRTVNAADMYSKDTFICSMKCVDEVGWEVMSVPAYTDIHGEYPGGEKEIMLSMRALRDMGIQNPKVGMEISFQAHVDLEHEYDETYKLCGYYTDYVNPAISPAVGYISPSQAEAYGVSIEQPDELMIQQTDAINGEEVEGKLYEDIKTIDKSQQFLGGNTFSYQIMDEFVGGYKMAAFGAVLIILSVFFLIQNVLSISMNRDIRWLGLLKTLGTTEKQIRQIYFRQIGRIILTGFVLGTLATCVVVFFIVPNALGNLYLYNFGKSRDLLVLRPELFVMAGLFTAAVTAAAAGYAVHRVTVLTPMEAIHYIGETQKEKKRSKQASSKRKMSKEAKAAKPGTPRQEIRHMAWCNLMRSRKRFVLTISSLFLGITVALGAMVIAAGTDYTNSINTRKDFKVSGLTNMKASGYFATVADNLYQYQYDEFSPMDADLVSKIESMNGVQKDTIEKVQGAYLTIQGGKTQPALTPKLEADDMLDYSDYAMTATVQIVTDSYIEELRTFAKKKGLKVDIDALEDGNGTLLLHEHNLSPTLIKEADQTIGIPFEFRRLPAKEWWGINERKRGEEGVYEAGLGESVSLLSAGYMDAQQSGFPKLNRTDHGPDILYFLVSEKGFEKLHTSKKVFELHFDVEKKNEPAIKIALQKLVQDENRKYNVQMGFYMLAKSDDLSSAQSYIRTNRIIMGALSATLIFMGILNYFNVIVTGLVSRQKEFAVMESIGMTGKQLRKLAVTEGLYYFGMIMGLVMTAGTGILKLVDVYMKSKLAYFKFHYPYGGIVVTAVVLGIICIGVPLVMYRRLQKTGVTERLAMNVE